MCDERQPTTSMTAADRATIVADWFDRHVDTIHRYIGRRAGEDVALELTAETFRIALERFERFDPELGNERAWLYGIATNLLRRHWRTEQRRRRAQLREATRLRAVSGDPLLGADERSDAERELRRVIALIERLPNEDRDLMILVAVEGRTSVEAGLALGIPPGTVRSRLNRIRTELRTGEDANG